MVNRCRVLALCLVPLAFVLAHPSPVQGWGGDIHRVINRAAADHLPDSFIAFSENADELENRSTLADARKSWDDDESIRHYIDIDDYPTFFTGTLPHAWADIVALYGTRRVEGNGILPWAVEDTYETLVTRFREQDWAGAVAAAADLGHYVGDLHNPLHLTENFDGQLTGQDGIHSRYESRLTGRYLEYLTPRPFTPVYVADPLESAFEWIDGQYPGVALILAADRLAMDETHDDRSDAYYAILWTELGAETQDWIRSAALRLASLWYSAWIDAGSPILPGSTPVASLLDFTATSSGAGIELAWRIADGSPARFLIQRRSGDETFAPLPGAVVDNGAATYPASFTWRDETAVPGVRYDYRLEVVLRDGTREIWDRPAGASLDPASPLVKLLGANPVRNGAPLGVIVDMSTSQTVRVTLYDVAGRPVQVLQDGTLGPGPHTAEMEPAATRSLSAGVYFLAVRGETFHESTRVVVLH